MNLSYTTKIFSIILLLNLMIISLFLSLNKMSDNFLNHNKHIVYSIANMKYITTKSHLWLEEYLYGDTKEYLKIDNYLQRAKKELNILMEGGEIRSLWFDHKSNDPKIKSFLIDFEKIT